MLTKKKDFLSRFKLVEVAFISGMILGLLIVLFGNPKIDCVIGLAAYFSIAFARGTYYELEKRPFVMLFAGLIYGLFAGGFIKLVGALVLAIILSCIIFGTLLIVLIYKLIKAAKLFFSGNSVAS